MPRFDDLIARLRRQHGDKLTDRAFAKQFVPYYNSGQRIEVSFCTQDGVEHERKRGTVGATCGWSPVFMLLLTKRSRGSMWLLGPHDKVLRVIR